MTDGTANVSFTIDDVEIPPPNHFSLTTNAIGAGVYAPDDDDPDHSDKDCVACGADADGIAKYEFAEHRGGADTYPYCKACAATYDDKYEIDHVVSGDLGLDE